MLYSCFNQEKICYAKYSTIIKDGKAKRLFELKRYQGYYRVVPFNHKRR
jgi:hypothetical protein